MQKVLIADSSEEFSSHLAQLLGRSFHIRIVRDGTSAQKILEEWKPEILVINLSLPETDGMTVLQCTAHTPPVILVISTFTSPYVLQSAMDAGAGYLLKSPCRVQGAYARLMDMIRAQNGPAPEDLQEVAARHLQKINITITLDGYTQLRVGLPLYAQDPDQTLSKEFYPHVAALCDISDWRSVERSIRSAIDRAYSERNDAVWARYFPPNRQGIFCRPTNKQFLRRMAQFLIQNDEKE